MAHGRFPRSRRSRPRIGRSDRAPYGWGFITQPQPTRCSAHAPIRRTGRCVIGCPITCAHARSLIAQGRSPLAHRSPRPNRRWPAAMVEAACGNPVGTTGTRSAPAMSSSSGSPRWDLRAVSPADGWWRWVGPASLNRASPRHGEEILYRRIGSGRDARRRWPLDAASVVPVRLVSRGRRRREASAARSRCARSPSALSSARSPGFSRQSFPAYPSGLLVSSPGSSPACCWPVDWVLASATGSRT